MSFRQLLIFADQELEMSSKNRVNPEKDNSRIRRRLNRFVRKLTGSSRRRRPAHQSLEQMVIKEEPKLVTKHRRRRKSFWRSLFRAGSWQARLTGNLIRKKSEPESVLILKPKDSLSKESSQIQRKRKKRKEKGFLSRVFQGRSAPKDIQRGLSESISPNGPGIHQSSVRHKKKKNIFRRFFGRTEKKPPKLILPSNKPRPPAEKEKVVYSDYIPYFVNSLTLFLLAYLVAWLTYQMAVIITSSFFNIDSVLFFFEVMFPVGNSSELWSSFNIILITISGPITSVVAGSLYYYFLVRRNKVRGNRLLFVNWLIVHSYCMFFAAFVAGVITNQGFGYVANWMYMNVFFKILFSLILLFTLSWISFKGSRHILETANSVFRIKSKNRMIFLISQTILPWFVGTILLIALKYPRFTPQHENILVYDLIIIVSVLFMIIPPFFNRQAAPRLSVERERKQTKISKRNILITLIALLVFRLGLAGGIHFVIQFAVNISRYLS